MKEPMKNIAKSEALILKEQVDYQPGQVVSKTLAQNDAVSVTLFSFDKGEEISTQRCIFHRDLTSFIPLALAKHNIQP